MKPTHTFRPKSWVTYKAIWAALLRRSYVVSYNRNLETPHITLVEPCFPYQEVQFTHHWVASIVWNTRKGETAPASWWRAMRPWAKHIVLIEDQLGSDGLTEFLEHFTSSLSPGPTVAEMMAQSQRSA